MFIPRTDTYIALALDRPDLGLHVGDTGIVRNTWYDLGPVCEVHFKISETLDRPSIQVAVLPADQVAPVPLTPFDPLPEGRGLYF